MHAIELPNAPDSAALARRFVRANARLDSMRHTEADLLVTELVTNVANHATEVPTFLLSVDPRDAAGMRVKIQHPFPRPIDGKEAGIGHTLVGRIARKWGHDHDGEQLSVWFVLRTPGTAAVSPDADDEELLDLMSLDPASYSDELIRRHSDLATAIARRYRRKGIDDDDLEQVAHMALLKAIQRFDKSLGNLRPYAAVTISGELKKLLRDKGWAVRVPRSLQERSLQVSRATGVLTQSLRRPPTADEIALHLDLSEEEVAEAINAGGAYSATSIDRPAEETGLSLLDRLEESDPGLLNVEERLAVEEAIALLPDRQQHILDLRFNEDLTQSEIAEILNISQMHVSRLLADAVGALRDSLSEESH